MKKSVSAVWIVIFVIFFMAPQVTYYFAGKYMDTANYEKRELAEKPVLDMKTITSFPDSFESYYNDTLPFRTQLIEWNSLINYYCFKESSVSKVIIGKEEWLFYNPKGANEDPIGDLKGRTLYSDEKLKLLKEKLIQIRDVLEADGKEFVIMIAPNKESIYGNKYLPDVYQSDSDYTKADQVVEYLKENSDLRIVYPKQKLLEAMETFPEYEFYYNSDTHWNQLGSYIGAKCLMDELGYPLAELERSMISHLEATGGDLANMMGLSKYIVEKNKYSLNIQARANVTLVSNESSSKVCYSSDSLNDKKIFLMRDSFTSGMLPYITDNFKETFCEHYNSCTPELLKEEDADIVVYEVVERYIDRMLMIDLVCAE